MEYTSGIIRERYNVDHKSRTKIQFIGNLGSTNWNDGVYTTQNNGTFKFSGIIGVIGADYTSDVKDIKCWIQINDSTQTLVSQIDVGYNTSNTNGVNIIKGPNIAQLSINNVRSLELNDRVAFMVGVESGSSRQLSIMSGLTHVTIEQIAR